MKYKEKVIPPALKTLQQPWPLSGQVPMAETLLRSGAMMTENGGSLQIIGADSKDIPLPTIRAFMLMCKQECFQPSSHETALQAYERLESHMLPRKVILSLGEEFRGEKGLAKLGKDVLAVTDMIIRAIPDKHLRDLMGIELGGNGEGLTDYVQGNVRMLAPSVTGAKRNYMALLLREIGRSFFSHLGSEDEEMLHQIHDTTPSARFGVDYLLGEKSRIEDQATFGVFVAENYMHFVTQGRRLEGFIRSLPEKERASWNEMMRIYTENFSHIMYVDEKTPAHT